MTEIPEELGCILAKGYKEDLPERVVGLNGRSFLYNPKATLILLAENQEQMDIFMDWFTDDLDYGGNTFIAEFPLFGVTDRWEVKIKGKPEIDKRESSVAEREIKLNLEVKNYQKNTII